MGHLIRKIDQLAGHIFKHYCVGEPRFLNKKLICQEISQIILNFLVERYQICKQEPKLNLSTDLISHLPMLILNLQVPLVVVKSGIQDQYRIDLATHNLTHDLNNFISTSHKMISRNMVSVLKKKAKLQVFKNKYQTPVSAPASDLQSLDSNSSSLDSNSSEPESIETSFLSTQEEFQIPSDQILEFLEVNL